MKRGLFSLLVFAFLMYLAFRNDRAADPSGLVPQTMHGCGVPFVLERIHTELRHPGLERAELQH